MKIKPEALTYTLYFAFLIIIIASTWVAGRWPEAINWVEAGLLLFVALMAVVVVVFSRKTEAK